MPAMPPFVQPSRRYALATLLFALAACASGPSPSTGPAPDHTGPPRTAPAGAPPLVGAAWPVRTREHLDLWLHSYALIVPDTTGLPLFQRGYRGQIMTLRRQRGVSTQLDVNRAALLARVEMNPSIGTNGQFLPLYFQSWEQMRQTIEIFVRAGGNPGMTSDVTLRTYFAILAQAFPAGADREWLRLFTASADDESRRFYHDYWTAELRARAGVIAHVDSLWQRQWRPALQRYLNNTQQQNGELYLSLPLGGEGRTVHFGKQENAVAVPLPGSRDDSDVVLYVMAHEMAGAVASGAVDDNTTPAERRSDLTSRFEQAAAIRAGALLLERTVPNVVPGYMRYYLQQVGRAAPTDPRAAFTAAFALPDAMRDAITRQIEVILGGI